MEDNGCGDAVTVLAAGSCDIRPLPPDQRFDVVVSEILGSDPLSEGVLPTLRHAAAALLAPGGEFVPSALVLRAALAEAGPQLASALRVGATCGQSADSPSGSLDLSALRPLEPPRLSVGDGAAGSPARLLTTACGCGVPVAGGAIPLSGRVCGEATGLADGQADCVVSWFELAFEGTDCGVATGPGDGFRPHWAQTLQPLCPRGAVRAVAPGQAVRLEARYAGERLLWFVLGDGPPA